MCVGVGLWGEGGVWCFLYRDPTGMRVEWDWRLEKKRQENSNIRKNTLEDMVAAWVQGE